MQTGQKGQMKVSTTHPLAFTGTPPEAALPALFWKNTQLPQTLFHGKSRIGDSIHLLCACSSTKHSSGYWRTFAYTKDDQSRAQVAQAAAAQPSERRELGVCSCCRMGSLTGDSLLGGGASLLLLWAAATRAHTNLEASCRKAIAFGGNICPTTEPAGPAEHQSSTLFWHHPLDTATSH